MNIAELFVNLGITGTKKTKDAVTEVKDGLKSAGSMALETKAAIVAAMYAVERLFSASNKAGTGLENFNAELGVSADTLQRYQYAAQQVGVSNEAVAGTFKNLQSAMTKILMGEGVPKGLARVALTVGGMEPQDLLEYQKHPEKLIQKLQEYAQKEQNVGMRNEVLKSFGLDDSMIAAISRQAFKPDVLASAPVYSDREIKTLDKNRAALANLQQQIEMAFGHFNAKHGAELIEGISKIVPEVLKLANAFMVLAEKLRLMEWFGDAIKGWTQILQGLTGIVTTLTGAVTDPKKAAELKQNTKTFIQNDIPLYLDQAARSLFGNDLIDQQTRAIDTLKKQQTPGAKQAPALIVKPGVTPTGMPAPTALAPSVAPVTNNNTTSNSNNTNNNGKSINVNVNQTNNFQGSPNDPHKTTQGLKESARSAFRQSAAQTVGA